MAQIEKLKILRERLCLDFMNTVGWHLKENTSSEYLTSYSVFVEWCYLIGIINREQANFFVVESQKRSLEAMEVFQRVIELRESVFRILLAVIAQDSPKQTDLAILNSEIDCMLPYLKLKYVDQGFVWENTKDVKNLDWMLSTIVQNITEFLTSDQLGRLKVCGDENCGWLFLDMSKNKSRRWCSMQDCGNRAKAKRHYSKMNKSSDRI